MTPKRTKSFHMDTLGEIQVVLLAGGFGSRLSHVLDDLPKPLAPVGGLPFVEWVIRFFASQGFRHFVLATGHRADQIERYVATHPLAGIEVLCRRETSPQGTAGAFLNAIIPTLSSSSGWVVANADSLILTDLAEFVRSSSRKDYVATILGLEVSDTARYGSLSLDESGSLTAFNEKRAGSGIVNAGVYWFSRAALDLFPKRRPLGFEREVFPRLLEKGASIGVIRVVAPFIDIGTPQSLAQAAEFVTSHLKPWLNHHQKRA